VSAPLCPTMNPHSARTSATVVSVGAVNSQPMRWLPWKVTDGAVPAKFVESCPPLAQSSVGSMPGMPIARAQFSVVVGVPLGVLQLQTV
jgi:hypothetical protein